MSSLEKKSVLSRRLFLNGALGATLTASPAFAAAPAILTGKGDIRKVSLKSNRLGESVDAVYWVEGRYIPEAVAEVSHLLRDWRENLVMEYDRRVIDIIAASHRLLDTSEPFEVLSGYRSPKTNAMLRRRNRGVAKNSYHTQAMAVDLRMKSRSVGQMFRAGVACHAGGVGRYSRSSFVHMDCGPVRTWGR